MPSLTRRGFLTRTSLGAAAVGAMSMAPGLGGVGQTAEVDTSDVSPALLSQPLVAHVQDLAAGEVSIMSGAREFVVRDPQLVMRMLNALRP
jgi:hypothetical protein